jgi:hypothetical protein
MQIFWRVVKKLREDYISTEFYESCNFFIIAESCEISGSDGSEYEV